MMAERERKVLSLKQKVEIIREVERNPHKNKSLIADEMEVSRTTLLNIVREKAKYFGQFESGWSDISRKRARGSKHGTVDTALLKWFSVKRRVLSPSLCQVSLRHCVIMKLIRMRNNIV